MTMNYQGMRWFKCDLHMHTPEGPGWNDGTLRLPNPRRDRSAANPEQALQDMARSYLRACHQAGLEVIAITDHNFSDCADNRERFLTHLVDQNETIAAKVGHPALVIFPGFEVDIGYHVLCLFEPVRRSANLAHVSKVLSELGLAEGRRIDGGNPKALRTESASVPLRTLLKKVQKEENGIVVAAHAFSTDGICEDSRHADDFRQNEDLLCVEVTKFPLEGRSKTILESPDGSWCRKNGQPSFVMSSDAKAQGSTGSETANTIGCRFAWIKMSEPSVEALRQAFLDHDNRIRLQDASPALDCPHGRIVSLAVQNARFLRDQTVHLSPELNCLIGGRGSGKSSLIEYLRILSRNDRELGENSEASKQVARIRGTLASDSVLCMNWQSKDGLQDAFQWQGTPGDQPLAVITSRSVAEPDTVFRNLGIEVYSQQQISELTDNEGASRLLDLIDRMAGQELSALWDQESQLKREIEQLFLVRRNLEQLDAKRKVLQQEIAELTRQWEARAAMQEPAREHKLAQDAKKHLEQVSSLPREVSEETDGIIQSLPDRFPPLPDNAKDWKHGVVHQRVDKAVRAAMGKVQEALRRAVEAFGRDIVAATTADEGWSEATAYVAAADDTFITACRDKGLTPAEVEELREVESQRRAKQVEMDKTTNEVVAFRRKTEALPDSLDRLAALWSEQTEKRRALLAKVQDGMARVQGDKPFVEFSLAAQGDADDFLAKWSQIAPDRRSRLGREWDSIGRNLHAEAISEGKSPWHYVAEALSNPELRSLGNGLDDFKQDLAKLLLSEKRDAWERLRLQRVTDALDFALHRQDGTLAGSLKTGGLSDGQRNTVVLSLLLSKGDGPVIVDQPEDELDSDFIFQELVPVVRHVKLRRQIIFATHNANLPVNGDAELVYALKAEGGHGLPRAQGGLDRAGVKLAVLDIMEGSETAFRRRQEKYHY